MIQEEIKEQNIFNTVYAWGLGDEYALGSGNKTCSVPILVQMPKEKFIACSTGGHTSAVLTQKGTVYLWGKNKFGRIGRKEQKDYAMTPELSTFPEKAIKISCGDWHTLVVTISGKVFATGYNKTGCLGLGNTNDVNTFVAVSLKQDISEISAGHNFSLFLDTSGKLLSCGHKSYLGYNAKENQLTPKNVLNELTFQKINCGYVHCGALTVDGLLYLWGSNENFQLGNGNKSPSQVALQVQGLPKIQQFSCSKGEKNCHTGAVDVDGNVYTWGSGYKGKLGHAENWSHQDSADEKFPKKIKFFVDNNIQASSVKCGGIHTAVLDINGGIWTFGCGSDGRLGHPESDNHTYLYKEGFPRKIEFFNNKGAVDLSCSYYHNVCIISG